jgi:hypothetical protein
MAGALWAQLAGKSFPEAPSVTQNETIAYFPQPSDAQLPQPCFQDIPQGEPELVQELLQPWPDRTLLFRLFTRLKRKSTRDDEVKISKTPRSDHLKAYEGPDNAHHETPSSAASKATLATTPSGRHDIS